MKKQYIYALPLLVVLSMACEDWVELRPENSVTFENAFDTEKDIESALLGTEQQVRIYMAGGRAPQIRGAFSDFHSVNANKFLELSTYMCGWSSDYNVIASANVSLPYLDRVEMAQERRDFYEGEIAFFKAFAYLDLIRRWGDCVLIRDKVELKPVGKTTWPHVADYAIMLAQDAVRLLPEWNDLKEVNGNLVNHRARPCKGVANAVLAHLCAWKAGCKYMAIQADRDYDEKKLWDTAEKACSAILEKRNIYDLESTPEEVCTRTFVDGGKECVFESVFRGYWNELDAIDRGGEIFNFGLYYESYPVVKGKKPGDIRKRLCRILNTTAREMFGEYVVEDDTIRDLRRDAWFYDFDNMDTLDASINGGYAYPYKWRYARVGTEGYMAGEFINFDQNKIWWRLADIYLLRAECRVRLNDRAGAIADLNTIRNRAKAKPYDKSEYAGDLRYAIFKEREKELLMEGNRYFDVLRNGYYKTELYGDFRSVSDQDVVDGVFFNALEPTMFLDNPLMRQNTYWLKRK